jgi:CRISPR system Cascade subunit CasE
MAFPDDRRRSADPHFLAPYNPSDFARHVHAPRDLNAGFLFRIDPRPGNAPSRHAIIVQSANKPDWEYAFQNAPELLVAPPLVSSFNPSFHVGQQLRFCLRANPTKRIAASNERLGGVVAGRRVGLLTEADQVRWLLRKGEVSGFRVPGEWVEAHDPQAGDRLAIPRFRVDVVPEGRARNDKPGHAGAFLAVRFEGVLTVTEVAAFRAAVAAGIGSGKAFGFGLLSVAPVGEPS